MNTKIDFSAPFLDNEGKEVEGRNLASVLSEILGTETEGNSLKMYGWHKSLQKDPVLNLDAADLQYLKEIVEKNTRSFVFVKGQIMSILFKL